MTAKWKEKSITTWLFICLSCIFVMLSLLSSDIQYVLFILSTLAGFGAWHIWKICTGKAGLYKPYGVLGWSITSIGLLAVTAILLFCIGADIGYETGIRTEVIIVVCAFICLAVGQQNVKMIPMDILSVIKWICHTGSVLLLLLLLIFFGWDWYAPLFGVWMEDLYSIGILSMMTGVLSSGLYVTEKNALWERIYIVEICSSFLVLGLIKNTVCLVVFFFMMLFMVVEIYPKKEYVKRSLYALFGFLFVISNLPILTNYTDVLRVSYGEYSLTNSILLDFIIGVMGIFAIYFWDKAEKLPAEDAETVLERMQYGFLYFGTGLGVLLFLLIAGKEALQELPGGMFIDILKPESATLLSELQTSIQQNVFMDSLHSYGFAGLIISIYIAVLIYGQAHICVWKCNRKKLALRMMVLFIGVVMLFFPIKIWFCGVGVLIIAYLLRGGLCREKTSEIEE